MTHKAPSLFDWNIVGPAIGDSFRKLDPRLMIRSPVMFVVLMLVTYIPSISLWLPHSLGLH